MLSLDNACLLLALAAVVASSQLCLKRYAMQGRRGKGLTAHVFQPWLCAGVILMLVNVLTFTWILRQVPLTTALPFTALVYVLVPLGAQHFFGEQLEPRFWLGALLLAIGVGLTAS